MELNREQLIKGLESCTNRSCGVDCPYYEAELCQDAIMRDALSLIKELTEENERLKSVEFTCGFIKPHKVLECPIFDEVARTKADTVREMQERLIAEFRKDGRMNYYLRMTLDQIAKEMLEGEDGKAAQ